MASRFPESGMAAILDMTGWSGAVDKYIRDVRRMDAADAASEAQSRRNAGALDRVTSALGKTANVQSAASKAAGAGAKANTTLAKSVFDTLQQLNLMPASAGKAAGQVDALAKVAATAGGQMALLAVGVAAAVAAFVALGMRGAAMPGVIEAFDVSARRAGTLASTLLEDLRTAARGTVSDMELLKTANLALAGASEPVAQALGDGGLAGLLRIARAQARATGQDVNYLFNSLVTGIKRGSPLLIDNTGLTLKVGEANEAYAASIGKAADQLTAEEQQIALLNATLEAGRVAVESYGNGALMASERLAQGGAMITNLLDRAAVAVQPLFNLVLAVGNSLLQSIIAPLQNFLLPLFYELSNAIFGPITRAFELFQALAEQLFAPVAETMHRWLTLIVGVIRSVGQVFNWLVEQAAVYLAPFIDVIKTYVIEPIAKLLDPATFARRGANVIGALATGFMWAANNFVYPAVLYIATMVADFLTGLSPAKRGPLSQIDTGAANLMRSWVEGFIGVPLDPVTAVAAEVDAALGGIGGMAGDAVRARLAQLDAELQPYLDRLEILRAQVESITEPLTRAKEALQTRLNTAVKGFFSGLVSAEQVRALDAQNEQLVRQLDLYESMTAEAEYQVAMMQSRQAVERALLGIQARRVGADKDSAAATVKAAGAVERAARATGGGGAAGEAAASAGGLGLLTPGENAIGDFLGVSDAEIAAFWGEMGTAFTEGLAEVPGFAEQMALFAGNNAALQEQFGRISGSPGFAKITGAFQNAFDPDREGSAAWHFNNFKGWLEGAWNTLFGENGLFAGLSLQNVINEFTRVFVSNTPGSIRGAWNSFRADIERKWNEIFGPEGLFATLTLQSVLDIFVGVFGDAGVNGSLVWHFNNFKTTIESAWNSVFGDDGFFAQLSLQNIVAKFLGVFGQATVNAQALVAGGVEDLSNSNTLRGIVTGFTGFLRRAFGSDLLNIISGIDLSGLITRFSDAFRENGVMGIIQEMLDFTKDVFFNGETGLFWKAVAGVRDILITLFVRPVETIVNGVIDLLIGAVNQVIEAINLVVDFANQAIPDFLGDIGLIGTIDPAGYHVQWAPELERGGMFAGLARVHRGEVLVGASSPTMVFPARWVEAMESLAATMRAQVYSPPPLVASAPPVYVQAGGGNAITNNFYGRTDEASVRRVMAQYAARA